MLRRDVRLLTLTGPGGVGKTRLALVEALCRDVRRLVRVLRGGCDPLSTPRPLGPLVDTAAGVGGELARLLGEQRPRERVFWAVLDGLAGRQPALVVFEDVHCADEATLDLLRNLGRPRGAATPGRRSAQRRERRTPVAIAEDGRAARLRDPGRA